MSTAVDIVIRRYKPQDHKAVCDLFFKGLTEHVPYASLKSTKKPEVICILALVAILGFCVHSWIFGLCLLFLGISLHAVIIYYFYYEYVK